MAGVLGEEGLLGVVVLEVDLLASDDRGVERRLGDVDVATHDQSLHLPVEERQQQGADVAAVHVGVAKQDHLVVADAAEVELVPVAAADRLDQRLDLGVVEHPVGPRPFDVEDLAPDREDGHGARVAGLDGRATGGVTLDDEEFALAGIA